MTPSYEIYSNTLSYGFRATSTVDSGAAQCPVLVGNNMLIFGGFEEPRQILEIYSWGSSITRRIGSLLFDFYWGTCRLGCPRSDPTVF